MRSRYPVLAAAAFMITACSSTPPPAAAPTPVPDSTQQQALARARQDSAERAAAALAQAQRLADQRRADSVAAARRRAEEAQATLGTMVHFDYDRAEIRPEDAAILDQKIPILRANPAARILIAGNCDERGSDEYNLALGNRRAIAVRQYLVDRGIEPTRIQTTSYGEEHPVDPGHNDAAWAKNRNDQFSVLNAAVVFEP